MTVAERLALRIARSHRFLRPLLERGRDVQVLSQFGLPRLGARTLTIDGTDIVDFATTSYLALDSDPDVIRACVDSLQKFGMHRYISRAFFSVSDYRALESRLARITAMPQAIVFPSVTSLHQAMLPLLTSKGSVVVADEQVHHSMHEALRACEDVEVRWIRHNDLTAMVAALADGPPNTDRLLLADGVYSLSGETAPIEKLERIAADAGALLYLDDSHGFGVFGQRGEGTPHRLRAGRENLIYVGSLSKAIGSYGAFVATSQELGAAIRDYAGGLLFSGPLPLSLLAGTVAATDVVLSPRLAELQSRLWDNQRKVVAALRNAGYEPLSTETPIICVEFRKFDQFSHFATTLRDNRVLGSVVAFPAVPRGHYRIRLSVSAGHTDEDIRALARAVQCVEDRRPVLVASPATV